MPVATLTNYLEANGIPLDNPAVETTSQLDWLVQPADHRGDAGLEVAQRPGLQPQATIRDRKRGPLALEVHGTVDMDGNPTADVATGLQGNLDALFAALEPPQHTDAGTYLLRLHHPTLPVRSAQGRLKVVRFEYVAGEVAALVLDGLIPSGVLRSEAVTNANSGSVSTTTNLTVPNPGNADQDEMVITLSGTATHVRLESRTWDPSGNTYLEVASDLALGNVVIDTAAFTAVRGVATDVHGLVDAYSPKGWQTWLPLVRDGNNTIRIVPTGGSVTVDIDHYPAWA